MWDIWLVYRQYFNNTEVYQVNIPFINLGISLDVISMCQYILAYKYILYISKF